MGAEPLTDEEYGRRWAAQNRKRVRCVCGRWGWYAPEAASDLLPSPLGGAVHVNHYPSEGAAFAALGAAVRRVHTLVPVLRDE